MRLPSVRNAVMMHFGVSLAIFLALVFIMMRLWYPGALFTMDGGVQGLAILAPVDLVLGPLLTLIFYRPHKSSVAFDMSFIAVVQVAALSFGIYSVYQQRPVALVFAQDRFETLSHSDYTAAAKTAAETESGLQSLEHFGPKSPRVIYAKGFTPKEYGHYVADLLNGKPELRERLERYLPLQQGRQHIEQYKIEDTLDTELQQVEVPASLPSIKPIRDEEHYPLKGRYGTAQVVLDRNTFRFSRVAAMSDK